MPQVVTKITDLAITANAPVVNAWSFAGTLHVTVDAYRVWQEFGLHEHGWWADCDVPYGTSPADATTVFAFTGSVDIPAGATTGYLTIQALHRIWEMVSRTIGQHVTAAAGPYHADSLTVVVQDVTPSPTWQQQSVGGAIGYHLLPEYADGAFTPFTATLGDLGAWIAAHAGTTQPFCGTISLTLHHSLWYRWDCWWGNHYQNPTTWDAAGPYNGPGYDETIGGLPYRRCNPFDYVITHPGIGFDTVYCPPPSGVYPTDGFSYSIAETIQDTILNASLLWTFQTPDPTDANYGAVEVDSPRCWLHVGKAAKASSYGAVDFSSLFASSDYAVTRWVRFRADGRSGALMMLSSTGTPAASFTAWLSADGGKTATSRLTVTATSAAIECDSERGAWVLLWENGGVIQRQVSSDQGATWSAAANVQKWDGAALANLTATIGDMAHDPRSGMMMLTAKESTATKVFSSDDMGATWTQRLS